MAATPEGLVLLLLCMPVCQGPLSPPLATEPGQLLHLRPLARATAQHCITAQHHSTAQRSAAQHSTAQHSTAQHSTAQHSAARPGVLCIAMTQLIKIEDLASQSRSNSDIMCLHHSSIPCHADHQEAKICAA